VTAEHGHPASASLLRKKMQVVSKCHADDRQVAGILPIEAPFAFQAPFISQSTGLLLQ
jgi:hypothetical protein